MPLVIVVAALLMFLPARAAFADGCTALGGAGGRRRVPDLRQCRQQERDVQPGPIASHPGRGKDRRASVRQWQYAYHQRLCRPGGVPLRHGARRRDHGQRDERRTPPRASARPSTSAPREGFCSAATAARAPSSPRTRRRARARAARAATIHLTAVTSISTEAGSVISADGKPCPGGEHHASRHPGQCHRRRAALLGEHVPRHGRAAASGRWTDHGDRALRPHGRWHHSKQGA